LLIDLYFWVAPNNPFPLTLHCLTH